MNKSFKVVFNKARGTLMAVNEATSSVQHKSAKIVTATAVAVLGALAANGAMANTAKEGAIFSYDGLKAVGTAPQGTDASAVINSDGSITVKASNVTTGSDNVLGYGVITNLYHPDGSTSDVLSSQGLTLTGSAFTKNTSTNAGGAVTLWQDGKKDGAVLHHVVKDSTFTENKANYGGAVALLNQNVLTNRHGTTTSEGNTYTKNTALRGGAIYAESTDVVSRGDVFKENSATGDKANADDGNFTNSGIGGAISVSRGSTLLVEKGTFDGNQAWRGGAIGNMESSPLVIKSSTFTNNKVSGGAYTSNGMAVGGALFHGNGKFEVQDSTFNKNSAAHLGGAIASVFDVKNSVDISGSTFSENQARAGGAMAIYYGLNVKNSTFDSNSTTDIDDGGAAIVFGGHAKASIDGSTFTNNKANLGGAISTRAATGQDTSKDGHWLQISNSKFIGNLADATLSKGTNGSKYSAVMINGDGGAIWNGMLGWKPNGTVENFIADSTFEKNEAKNHGGAIYNQGNLTISGTTTFTNNKAVQGGAIYTDANTLTLSATDADDVISFVGNTATAANGGTDLYVGDLDSTNANVGKPVVELVGKGSINFGGSIAGVTTAEMNASANNVSIADAKAYAGTYNLQQGTTTIAGDKYFGGAVNVKGGTLAITGTTIAEGSSATTITDGVLRTAYSNVFTGTGDSLAVKTTKFTYTGGVLELTAYGDSYTLEDLKKLQAQLKGQNDSGSQVTLVDCKLDDADATLDKVLDASANVFEETIKASVKEVGGKQTVEVTTAGTGTVKAVTAEGVQEFKLDKDVNLTLAGSEAGDELIQGAADALAVTLEEGSTLGLGQNAASQGVLSASVNADGSMEVKQGSFVVDSVKLGDKGTLTVGTQGDATLNLQTLSGTGNVSVGKNTTDSVNTAGTLYVQTLDMTGGSIFLDPAWLGSETYGDGTVLEVGSITDNKLQTQLLVGQNSMAVLNGTKAQAVAAAEKTGLEYGENKDITAVLYVGAPIEVGATGAIYVNGSNTTKDSFSVDAGTVNLEANSLTVINTAGLTKDDVIFKVVDGKSLTVDGVAKVYLTDISKADQTFTLTNGQVTANSSSFITNNKFFGLTLTDKTVTAGLREFSTTDAASKIVTGLYGNGVSKSTAAFLEGLTEGDAFVTLDNTTSKIALTGAGSQVVNEFASAAVSSGIYNVAYDVQSELADAVTGRLLSAAQPETFSVWADVFASSNKTDTLYGSTGYSADIYGAVLGADYTLANGLRLGAAFTGGTADAEAEGTYFKQENDADFYGLTFYAAQDFGGMNVKGDVAYLRTKNDLSGAYASESIDTDVWSIGVRSDFLVHDGAVKVLPHVGLRYTYIDSDDLTDRESGSLNVFEAPIGVTVKGDISAGNWMVTPTFDASVVPQLGDKSVETTVGNVALESDVLDGALFKTALGVSATSGNMTFDLKYHYGFANDDRNNHTVKANFRYVF